MPPDKLTVNRLSNIFCELMEASVHTSSIIERDRRVNEKSLIEERSGPPFDKIIRTGKMQFLPKDILLAETSTEIRKEYKSPGR